MLILRSLRIALCAVMVALTPGIAHAFTIETAVTPGCHEALAIEG